MTPGRIALVCAGAGSWLGALHAARNPLRRPPEAVAQSESVTQTEPVSVCLPVRNEAHRLEAPLRALVTAVRACPDAELLILDDGSTDGTRELVTRVLTDTQAPRARVLIGAALPAGWLGKAHACEQLARAARPSSGVLVFVDADVTVTPNAIERTVQLLRASGLQLVSPYPRQVCGSVAERIVQPLLQWSWLTFLPLRLAERSGRPSLSAANGQLLAVDRAALQRAGGFAAVRADVLDDLALVRAVKRTGGRGGVVDGTAIASCRMYDGWGELRDGYTKSLWSAFGSPVGAAAATSLQLLLYCLPAAAMAHRGTRLLGLTGYAGGVIGRVVTARRTGGRAWPDALAHPVSVATVAGLTARSFRLHRRGRLVWKGRPL